MVGNSSMNMIGAAVVGLGVAGAAQAAIFNDVASGNYNSGTTFKDNNGAGAFGTPGSPDTVNIDSNNVRVVATSPNQSAGTLNLSTSATTSRLNIENGGSLTIGGGTLSGNGTVTNALRPSGTLNINGLFSVTSVGDLRVGAAGGTNGGTGTGLININNGGTLDLNQSTTTSNRFTLDNGTDISVNNGGTLKFSAGGSATANDINNAKLITQSGDGAGTVILKDGSLTLVNPTTTEKVVAVGTNGIVDIQTGAQIRVESGEFIINTSTQFNSATVFNATTLSAGIYRILNGAELDLRKSNVDFTTIGTGVTVDLRGTAKFSSSTSDRLDNVVTINGTFLNSDKTYDSGVTTLAVSSTGTVGGGANPIGVVTYVDNLAITGGTVAPGLDINDASTVGDDRIGRMTASNNVTFNGGNLNVQLLDNGGTTSDGLVDLLNVVGNLAIGSASVNFSSLAGLLNDDSYIFASYSSLTGGSFATQNNVPTGYNIDYNFNGNQIALVATAIPEPALLTLLGLGGLLLLPARRSREQA